MSYKVLVPIQALNKIYDIALWWSENRNTQQSLDWLSRLSQVLTEIGNDPFRYQFSAEAERLKLQIRDASFGLSRRKTHRVVFTIDQPSQTVYIRAIRHLAQDEIKTDDLT